MSETNSETVISVRNISKMYPLYADPRDRLRQSLWYALPQFLRRNRTTNFYEEFWALKDISFEVAKGKTVGIIGRNGSGKSTLLQIIAGTLSPSWGEVQVNGRVAALLELGSGFNFDFTGRENIYLNGTILGLSYEEIEDRLDTILAFADIGQFIDQPVKLYSSGMFARLAFAVAVNVDPDILIADEILAVGDMAFQAKCFRRFHQLRESGCTILFVSHDVYTVRSFCQESLYLKEGHQMAWGASYGVIDRYVTDIEKNQIAENRPQPETPQQDQNDPAILFNIKEVLFVNEAGQFIEEMRSGETVAVKFRYTSLTDKIDKVVFVVNLYKQDGFYICGTTSLMDKLSPLDPGSDGWVTIHFPNLNLLTGNYYWRVAIDDEHGFGVYAAVNHVCPFKVNDRLEAVGLINLSRHWDFDISN